MHKTLTTQLHRTKKDEMLGCKIIDVPHCTKQELWVPLSTEESIVLE
jgi:hypothetical protein